MQDFCRPKSEIFSGYIDYLAREEAQRTVSYTHLDVTTAKEVAEELGVSRSTLFRRIKEAKKQGVDYIE